MSKFGNAMGNTIAVPVRGVGTTLNTGADVVKTGWNVISDMGKVVSDTGKKARETLSSSWNAGKWYNKLYQVPAGVVISGATIVEGAVRTVVEPARNLFLNVRDSVGNFFKNIGNILKRTFDTTTPVSDFSYEKLKMKEPIRENWTSKLAWWKK